MKKILSSQQIRQVDAHTIQTEPISSLDLMERASKRVADRICSLCDNSRRKSANTTRTSAKSSTRRSPNGRLGGNGFWKRRATPRWMASTCSSEESCASNDSRTPTCVHSFSTKSVSTSARWHDFPEPFGNPTTTNPASATASPHTSSASSAMHN